MYLCSFYSIDRSTNKNIFKINESKPVKEKKIDGARIKKMEKGFNELRDRFSKPKMKIIRKGLYRIENKKIEEIEKNLLKLEKSLSRLKKYHDYDDVKYRGIRDVRKLFNLLIDEDCYKPVRTNSGFNGNYIEYECKEDKNKTLSIKGYLNMIKQYLRDIINDYKTQGE